VKVVATCALARLLDYEEWANNETAAALTASGVAPDHRARKIFAHIGATYTLWLSRLRLCPANDIWPDPRNVDPRALLASGYKMWRNLFNRDETFWATPITHTNTKGETWSNTPRDIFTHIQLHSSYHRGQIAILLTHMARGTDDHVLHLVRADLRIPLEERVDTVREHVVGTGQVEAAPKGLGEASANAVDDYDVFHEYPPVVLSSFLSSRACYSPLRSGASRRAGPNPAPSGHPVNGVLSLAAHGQGERW